MAFPTAKQKELIEYGAQEAKQLALIVQAAFVEELDWDLELNYRDGFVYGEFKQENGLPHGDVLVFVNKHTIYDINDPILLKDHSIVEIMLLHPSGFFHNLPGTREWARRFVHQFH